MSAGVLDSGVPIDVRQEPQTEAIVIIGRIGEAVDHYGVGLRVEYLPDPRVQLVVGYRAPKLGLLVCNLLHIGRHIRRVHRVVATHGVVIPGRVGRRRCLGHWCSYGSTGSV